jgi:hypothetical protein
LNFAQLKTFPTHFNTSFSNKKSFSYQRKYDGEIAENRKVGNPVVFFVEGFLAYLKYICLFFVKTLTMPIFREIEEGWAERCNI